jgi:hypothetical protein
MPADVFAKIQDGECLFLFPLRVIHGLPFAGKAAKK